MPTLIAVHPENDPRGDGLELAKASGASRLHLGGTSALFRLYFGYPYTSAVPRLYLGCASAVPRLYLGCTSVVPRLYLGCTSAAPRLYLGCTSAVPRPYLRQAYAAATGGDRAGVLESSFVAEVKSDVTGERKGLAWLINDGRRDPLGQVGSDGREEGPSLVNERRAA